MEAGDRFSRGGGTTAVLCDVLQEAAKLQEQVEETQSEVAQRERAAVALQEQLAEQRLASERAVKEEKARVAAAERAGAETAAELADRQRLNEALQVSKMTPPPPHPIPTPLQRISLQQGPCVLRLLQPRNVGRNPPALAALG